MQTVTGHYRATFEYHNDIEAEVPDDATLEEIQQALKEVAEINFDEIAQIANGMTPYIEVTIDDGDQEEAQPQATSSSDAQNVQPNSSVSITIPKNIKKRFCILRLTIIFACSPSISVSMATMHLKFKLRTMIVCLKRSKESKNLA